MRVGTRTLFACLLILSAAACADNPRKFTDDQWREDIKTFGEKLRTMHLKPFHAVSEESFNAAVNDLTAKLPKMSDEQIALELTRIAALIGDGHTWIAFGDAIPRDRLPLELFEFADGVFVKEAMPGFESRIGDQVLSIGGASVETLLEHASPYASRDNEWSLRDRRVSWLAAFPFLEHENATTPGKPVSVQLKTRDGKVETVEFARVPWPQYLEWATHPIYRPGAGLPLYRKQADKSYWLEYLKDHEAVYMKFNSVTNLKDGPHLAAFSEELIQFIEDKKAKKLIIDARDNGGGNGDLLKPLIRRIAENKRINKPGHLFVITGRETFSAALMFTVRMERQTHAIFAGEPGGGKPNSYSERTNFKLPNTGMSGSISSRWHEEGEPNDTRDFVPVTISVPPTAADYFANRDPVLDAVLAYKP